MWKISVSTSLIDKLWGLVVTGLADVYGFKWYILQCIRPCIIPLYGSIVNLLQLDGYKCHSMNMKWRVGVSCHWTLLKIIAARTMDLNSVECAFCSILFNVNKIFKIVKSTVAAAYAFLDMWRVALKLIFSSCKRLKVHGLCRTHYWAVSILLYLSFYIFY